jgi:membrane protein required for colicin V production
MVLDIIVLILSILAFIRGWQKGLLWALCSFVAVFAGLFLSLKLSHVVANYLFTQHVMSGNYVLLICFVGIFLITMFVFRMAIRLIEKLLDKMFLGSVNKILGGLLYSCFTLFIISSFLWLANSVKMVTTETKSTSKIINYIEPIAPKMVELFQGYIPYCKNLLGDLKTYATKVNERSNQLIPITK